MAHYQWSTRAVGGGPTDQFAAKLTEALNELEQEGYEVDNVMDAPQGRRFGVVVIGKRPQRFARSSP